MERVILILLQALILWVAILMYRNAQKMLKDKKDEFKRVSGMDYDEYIKRQK
jgi:hypothetical protein